MSASTIASRPSGGGDTASSPAPLCVGARVCDSDGFTGTVRYIGPVATSKSQETIYAGIEWDSSTRGKNDGSVTTPAGEVVRYFTCAAGAGSFLKAELVQRGVDLLSALQARYMDMTAVETSSLTGMTGKAVPIMLVGDEKIRAAQRLEKLGGATLRKERISWVAPGSVAMCARLRELDLRGNLIWSWDFIRELGSQLPALTTLDISENRMLPLTDESAAALAGCLPQLRTLIVNDTQMPWQQIMQWSKLAPALEELHACNNGLKELVASPARLRDDGAVTASSESFIHGAFRSVRVLNLSDNALEDWGQVFALAHLPALAWLLVSNNKIGSIWTDAASAATPFATLEQLSITGNNLESLSALDALDAFPALTALRIGNADLKAAAARQAAWLTGAAAGSCMPPSDISPSEARQIVVARLPKIFTLNNSEVRAREREDAEKAYTRRLIAAFLTNMGKAALIDLFPPISTAGGEHGGLRGPASAAACAAVPEGVRTSADTGVIRSKREGEQVSIRSAYPLFWVSGTREPKYVPELDPFGLGASVPETSAELQRLHPRYFLCAARFDMHAPAAKDPAAASNIASSVVSVTLKPMSGNSCTMPPASKKLPVTMTVGDMKTLVQRLFKCDPALQRLSFRDSPASYPSLLDDDNKTLAYYAVTDGGDILIEEVDAIAMQKQAEQERRAREAKIAQQAATGDALRRAQEMTVAASRQAVVATAAKFAPKPEDDERI